MSFGPLWDHIKLSARNPVEGAAQIVQMQLSRQVLWTAFSLVVVLHVILASLLVNMLKQLVLENSAEFPPEFVEIISQSQSTPFLLLLSETVFLFLAFNMLNRVGQAMGGKGDYDASLAIMILIQFFISSFIAVQIFLMLTIPAFNALIGPIGLIYLFWLIPGLVMGLHGFQSRFSVLVMMILCFFVLNFILSLLSVAFGLSQPVGSSNV